MLAEHRAGAVMLAEHRAGAVMLAEHRAGAVMLAEHHHGRQPERIVTQTIDPCCICACSPDG